MSSLWTHTKFLKWWILKQFPWQSSLHHLHNNCGLIEMMIWARNTLGLIQNLPRNFTAVWKPSLSTKLLHLFHNSCGLIEIIRIWAWGVNPFIDWFKTTWIWTMIHIMEKMNFLMYYMINDLKWRTKNNSQAINSNQMQNCLSLYAIPSSAHAINSCISVQF